MEARTRFDIGNYFQDLLTDDTFITDFNVFTRNFPHRYFCP